MIAGISIFMLFKSFLWLVAAGLFVWFFVSCFVIIGGDEIGVVERKYIGKGMPQGRVIAQTNEVGIQARTFGPGLHFLIPFIYSVEKVNFVVIKDNEIGLIESIDGDPIPPGRIFGKVVEGHNSFQDGEVFLKNAGQKGPQLQILPPGTYRINTALFKVTKSSCVRIERNQIGVVTSMDGGPMTAGRILADSIEGHNNFENGEVFLTNGGQKGPQTDILLPGTYRINPLLFRIELTGATVIPPNKIGLVTARDGKPLPEGEYVAKSVEGHNDFQNTKEFIKKGGQRGPQLDVLKPGTYYINPLMFEVSLDDVATVERGQVAVIISNVGEEPKSVKELVAQTAIEENGCVLDEKITKVDVRLDKGIERYVVPQGYRGIQQEVAGPGIYYLNRRAFIAYIIDTTNITVDWDREEATKFDPLKVVSKDGFEISVSVKVIIRVRPDQAPYMVAKIGSIENLIDHVIHPMIDSSFRNQASAASAMSFMQDRQDEQKKAEDRAKIELERYHVECVSVLICQIELPPDLMLTQTERIIADQQMAMYKKQQEAQQERISMEKTRAEADQQPVLVTAEIGVKVAQQDKIKAITTAEGLAQSTKLKAEGEAAAITLTGNAEGAKILAIGESTARAYELQKKAIGGEGIVALEVTKAISEGKIKVTPDFLVQGGGGDGLGGLLSAFLTQKITSPTNGKEDMSH